MKASLLLALAASGLSPALAAAGADACAAYKSFGPQAMAGCEACKKTQPSRIPKCMMCGTTCMKTVCKGKDVACRRQPAFTTCFQKCLSTPAPPPAKVCDKYASWGPTAVQGCHVCRKTMPFKVDLCMNCGRTCLKQHCPSGKDKDCGKRPAFKQCHRKCLSLPAGGKAQQACAKYRAGGPKAVTACHQCLAQRPRQLEKCMGCGKECFQKLCAGKDATRCKNFPQCRLACVDSKTDAAAKTLVV